MQKPVEQPRGLTVVPPIPGPTPEARLAELKTEARLAIDELAQTERRMKVVGDASAQTYRAQAAIAKLQLHILERMAETAARPEAPAADANNVVDLTKAVISLKAEIAGDNTKEETIKRQERKVLVRLPEAMDKQARRHIWKHIGYVSTILVTIGIILFVAGFFVGKATS